MERHAVNEEDAFRMLRDQARRSQKKIVDIAEAVLSSHTLLPSGSKERLAAQEAAGDQRS